MWYMSASMISPSTTTSMVPGIFGRPKMPSASMMAVPSIGTSADTAGTVPVAITTRSARISRGSLALDLDGVRIDERGVALEEVHDVARELRAVDIVLFLDHVVASEHQVLDGDGLL